VLFVIFSEVNIEFAQNLSYFFNLTKKVRANSGQHFLSS